MKADFVEGKPGRLEERIGDGFVVALSITARTGIGRRLNLDVDVALRFHVMTAVLSLCVSLLCFVRK